MTLPPPPRVEGLPVIGSTRDLLRDAGGFLVEHYRRLGPVFDVRAFGQRFTVMAGAEALDFLVDAGERHFSRASFYTRFARELGTSEFVLGTQGARHHQLRKVMRFAFSRQVAAPFIPAMLDHVQGRMREWRSGQRLRVPTLMADLAFGSYCLLMGGTPMRELFEDALVYSETIMRVGGKTRPAWFLAFPRYRRAKRAVVGRMRALLHGHRERPHDPDRPFDLFHALVESSRECPGFGDDDIVATALYGFVGTLVYTNRLLAYLAYELLRDPGLLAQATAEADAFATSGDRTPQGLRTMRVLHSAYLETLRFHPIALGLPFIAEEDVAFAGRRIARGSAIVLSPVPAHFSPAHYTCPHTFDAARCRPPRDEIDAPGAFVPFGLDGRVCAAVGLVEILCLSTMATLLHGADLRLEPPDYALRSELDPLPGPEDGFTIRVAGWRTLKTMPARLTWVADAGAAATAVESPDWAALVDRAAPTTWPAGTFIVREGDSAEHFYVVLAGTVDVVKQREDGGETVLATLGPGEFFGEIGLLRRVPRTAGVRARSAVTAVTIDRATFVEMVAESDMVGEQIAATVSRRVMATRLAEALPRIPPDELARVLPGCRLETHVAGDSIVRQGDPASAFYVVATGRVDVVKERDGHPDRAVRTLGPGEWFGEMGILLDRPRVATVRASPDTDVEVVAIDADDFRALVGGSGATRSDVWAAMMRRLGELERG